MQKKSFSLIFGLVASLAFGCKEAKKTASNTPAQQPQNSGAAAAQQQNQPTNNPSPTQNTPPANGQSLNGTTNQTPATAPAKPNPVMPKPTGVGEPTTSLKVPTAQKKPLSASKMAFLTEQNWLVTLASDPKLFEKAYVNRWLIFQKDQTFQIFNDAKATHSGRWAFDEANETLFMNTDNPYFNNSWKCQVFKKNMLLLGNTELNATGIQVRLYMTDKKPGELKSDGN